MRVGLIVPPWHYWANPKRIQPLYEMGFATLIDERAQGRDVQADLIDLRETTAEQWSSLIPERDLYVYWIMKSGDHNNVRDIVAGLRERFPRARHLGGGTHVTVTPETQQACAAIFDGIIIGPGEETILRAIEDWQGTGALRSVYQDDYRIVRYGRHPWPRRHYLPEDAIVVRGDRLGNQPGTFRSTTIAFSRGCAFDCSFCVLNVPNMLQFRAPASMEEEIDYLKREYQVQALSLRDEICIPLSRRLAAPYLETLGRSGLFWRGQTVINTDKEMVALAARSGCVELAFGVESASQQVLDINCVRKDQTVEEIKEMLRYCKSLGIRVKVCLVFGLPGEPSDIVEITRKFLEETRPDFVALSALCPFPGSPIARDPAYYGIRFLDKDWGKYAHLLYRYSDDEEVQGLPFEYEPVNRWGKTFTRAQILENIRQVQHDVREQGMIGVSF